MQKIDFSDLEIFYSNKKERVKKIGSGLLILFILLLVFSYSRIDAVHYKWIFIVAALCLAVYVVIYDQVARKHGHWQASVWLENNAEQAVAGNVIFSGSQHAMEVLPIIASGMGYELRNYESTETGSLLIRFKSKKKSE